jgi:hypothetical protein
LWVTFVGTAKRRGMGNRVGKQEIDEIKGREKDRKKD